MAVPTVDPTALMARDAASAAAAWEGADAHTLDAEVAAYRTLLARLRADLALAGVPCNLEDGGDGEALSNRVPLHFPWPSGRAARIAHPDAASVPVPCRDDPACGGLPWAM